MEVAVIIPTFNRPDLLRRAVGSAILQEKLPREIIVVNDGPDPVALPESTLINVQSEKVLIRCISTEKRQGPTYARTLALKNLSPNINAVCYLDDDDELLSNHISLLSAELDAGAHFAFSRATYKHTNGTQTEDPEPGNSGPKRYYDPEALLSQNIAPVSSFMHTVEASTEIGGWDCSLVRMEDWDFWARMYIRYGAPKFVNAATNVIYKGLGENRTDSNIFVYAMSCSWRDIVADRIKHMSAQNRSKVTFEDLVQFHIPKIGVVMPVFNAEKYLRPAVESILTQSFTGWELIAVNDGSTDSSRRILEEYAVRDRRIRIFDMPRNSGVTAALNYGLLVSRSEYVARMDADDISDPSRFFWQQKYLDEHRDVMVVGTNFCSMNEDLTKCIWVNDLPKEPEDVRKALLESCCIGHPTVMMRRRIIEILGGYSTSPDHKAVEDYELWLRISQKYKIANIGQSLLTYRHHDSQVSSRLEGEQRENARKVRAKYRQLGAKNGPEK